jgi:hypothetical protein
MAKVRFYLNYISLDAALANLCFAKRVYGVFCSLFANDNYFKRGMWVKVFLDTSFSSLLERSNTSHPL